MAIFLNILIVAYHIRVVNEKNVKFKKNLTSELILIILCNCCAINVFQGWYFDKNIKIYNFTLQILSNEQ